MRKLFVILFLIIFIFSCNTVERNRPTNLPKTAFWIGGIDGGCWIIFDSVSNEKIEATIFYENGDIWEKGIFRKLNNCKSEKITVDDISSFDGGSLNTKQGCVFKK